MFVCGLLFSYLLFVYHCLFVNWYTMFDGVTRDLFLEQVCVKGLPVVFTDEPCIGLIGRQGKGTSSWDTKTEVFTTVHSLMIVYMQKKKKRIFSKINLTKLVSHNSEFVTEVQMVCKEEKNNPKVWKMFNYNP